MSGQTQRFDANLAQLATIRRFVQQPMEASGIDDAIIDDVVFATNEIATNIIEHGYRHEAGKYLDITVTIAEQTVTVILRDTAPVFDPTHPQDPDFTLPLENRPLGKVGMFLTIDYMDDVRHRALGATGNEITLIKHW